MQELVFDTSKGLEFDLGQLEVGSMTIKEIVAESFDMLNQVFDFNTVYPDGTLIGKPLFLKGFVKANTKEPIAKVDFKVSDSDYTTITAKNQLDTKYTIRYETFADTIKRLNEEEDKTKEDIKERVKKWTKAVSALYSDIKAWLEPYQGSLEIEENPRNIIEEGVGEYTVSQLQILFVPSNVRIVLNPVGTFVVGADGRIDVTILDSPNFKNVMLVLHMESEGKTPWSIIENREVWKALPFTKGQMLNLLSDVV